MADGVAEADIRRSGSDRCRFRRAVPDAIEPKDEGALDPAGKRRESFGDHVRQAARLTQDAGKFLEIGHSRLAA